MSHKQIAEESCQVPVWIITFSDMTTNLLTFFVLLISMAHIRSGSLLGPYDIAEFLNLVKQGFGFSPKMNFGCDTIKYFIEDADKGFKSRTIDTREENIRRIFKEIAPSMTTMPSNIVANKTIFCVTSINFPPGNARLNEPAKKFLNQFVMDLPQKADDEELKLYVLGLARDEQTEKGQWLLSARRAQTVADFLSDILPTELPHSIYSWGAGSGILWTGEKGLDTSGIKQDEQLQILIAVLRANN